MNDIKLRPYQEELFKAIKDKGDAQVAIMRDFIASQGPHESPYLGDVLTVAHLEAAKFRLLAGARSAPVFIDEAEYDIPPRSMIKSLNIRPIRSDYYRESIEFKPMHYPKAPKLIVWVIRNTFRGLNV